MLLYLELEDYLAQWFVHDQGGVCSNEVNLPLQLRRGSVEWNFLEIYLTTPPSASHSAACGPENIKVTQTVAIQLPNFRSKDTRYHFYLPPKATEAFKHIIRTRFDLEMWEELSKFSNVLARQDNLIYSFMEKHGIELTEKNWNAIAKRYQRKRDIYKRKERREKNEKNRSNLRGAKSDLSDLSASYSDTAV